MDEAATGPETLTLAAANDYDAIVLDVLLPGKNGIVVCQALRERGSRVPILMLTALDGVEQRIAGLDSGADDYLTKPFDFGELLARLRAATRRGGDVVPAQLVVGDLVIDTLRHAVRRDRREIGLTAKEFAFLVYLARNAGRVVSRAELVSHVWDQNHDPLTNAVEVYINRLRKKVDTGRAPLIHTRRGSGYMLSERAEGDPARER